MRDEIEVVIISDSEEIKTSKEEEMEKEDESLFLTLNLCSLF
jgi:hypothetical protein